LILEYIKEVAGQSDFPFSVGNRMHGHAIAENVTTIPTPALPGSGLLGIISALRLHG